MRTYQFEIYAASQTNPNNITSIVIPPGGIITASGGQRLISQLYVLLMNRGAAMDKKKLPLIYHGGSFNSSDGKKTRKTHASHSKCNQVKD